VSYSIRSTKTVRLENLRLLVVVTNDLVTHALELEKSHQISISLATCVSQCNISLVLGVSLMRRAFNTS
jgi:hypothetical protein